jgi:hypothetical protein
MTFIIILNNTIPYSSIVIYIEFLTNVNPAALIIARTVGTY